MREFDNSISGFWSWFQSDSALLGQLWRAGAAVELDKMLSPRVEALVRGARWEIGPDGNGQAIFVFTPGGDRQRLHITKQVVAKAPKLDGWRFLHAKPPKFEWDFRFDLFNSLGEPLRIDASGWRYTVVAYDSRSFFDVTVYAKGEIEQCNDVIRNEAAMLVVEGAVGEEFMIERIGSVRILVGAEINTLESGSIPMLKQHLASLCCP